MLLYPALVRSIILVSLYIQLLTASNQRLVKQLDDLDVPFVDDFPSALASADHVVDAIFGSWPAAEC
jgi:hypothetical protein